MSDFPAGISNISTVIKLIETDNVDINQKYGPCQDTLLHHATEGCFINVVKYLIEHGANVNIQDSYGHTPLHNAAACGYLNIVKYLVESGADVNALDNHNDSTLHHSCYGCEYNIDVVEYLLANGADRLLVNNDNLTAEGLATMEGFDGIARCINDYAPVGSPIDDLINNDKIKINIIL